MAATGASDDEYIFLELGLPPSEETYSAPSEEMYSAPSAPAVCPLHGMNLVVKGPKEAEAVRKLAAKSQLWALGDRHLEKAAAEWENVCGPIDASDGPSMAWQLTSRQVPTNLHVYFIHRLVFRQVKQANLKGLLRDFSCLCINNIAIAPAEASKKRQRTPTGSSSSSSPADPVADLTEQLTELRAEVRRHSEMLTSLLRHFNPGGADTAYYHPVRAGEELPLPGDIVGLKNGEVTKDTSGCALITVVPQCPAIKLGKWTPRSVLVAYLGQVDVLVSNAPPHLPADVQYYVTPSGNNDGRGLLLRHDELRQSDSRLVGHVIDTAWRPHPPSGCTTVRVSVHPSPDFPRSLNRTCKRTPGDVKHEAGERRIVITTEQTPAQRYRSTRLQIADVDGAVLFDYAPSEPLPDHATKQDAERAISAQAHKIYTAAAAPTSSSSQSRPAASSMKEALHNLFQQRIRAAPRITIDVSRKGVEHDERFCATRLRVEDDRGVHFEFAPDGPPSEYTSKRDAEQAIAALALQLLSQHSASPSSSSSPLSVDAHRMSPTIRTDVSPSLRTDVSPSLRMDVSPTIRTDVSVDAYRLSPSLVSVDAYHNLSPSAKMPPLSTDAYRHVSSPSLRMPTSPIGSRSDVSPPLGLSSGDRSLSPTLRADASSMKEALHNHYQQRIGAVPRIIIDVDRTGSSPHECFYARRLRVEDNHGSVLLNYWPHEAPSHGSKRDAEQAIAALAYAAVLEQVASEIDMVKVRTGKADLQMLAQRVFQMTVRIEVPIDATTADGLPRFGAARCRIVNPADATVLASFETPLGSLFATKKEAENACCAQALQQLRASLGQQM